MQQILKRLELIKTAISIEDEEIIELQVLKLQKLEADAKVEAILEQIAQKDYSSVIQNIEAYLKECSGLVVYEDKEVQGLRLELKALERKLQELTLRRDEHLSKIHDFNLQYHLRLGEIIQKILALKESLLERKVEEKREAFEEIKETYQEEKRVFNEQKQKVSKLERELESMDEFDPYYDELYAQLKEEREILLEEEEKLETLRKKAREAKEAYEEDEATKAYREAQEDFRSFHHSYEEAKEEKQFDLSKEELAELKRIYRKASRLCHPDLVRAELQEQAHAMMQQLNDAYNKHDLKTVKEMLLHLESGRGFDIVSDTITDKRVLKEKIVDVRARIVEMEAEIAQIEEDEVFQILQEYDDIADYLDGVEAELQEEYARLCEEEKQVAPKDPMIEDEAYWDVPF